MVTTDSGYMGLHLGRSGGVSEDGIEKGIGDVLMVLSTAANLST